MSTNSDLSFDKVIRPVNATDICLYLTRLMKSTLVGLRSQDYAGKGDKAIFLKYLG